MRLTRRAHRRLPTWRLPAALGGLVTIAIALASPVDDLAHTLFVGHMVQHMLLVMIAAPVLLLANPFPVLLWALPRGVRHLAGRLLAPGAPLRRAWSVLTRPAVAWLASAATLWLWHLPIAYDAALDDALLHHVEHLTLFGGAVLFWWPVVHPAPRVRRASKLGARVVYVVLGGFQTSALGLVLVLSPVALYARYAATAPTHGLAPLEDQVWGGVVMWGLSGLVDMGVVLALLYRLFGDGERASSGETYARRPGGSLTASERCDTITGREQ